jgi:hypothetical protein
MYCKKPVEPIIKNHYKDSITISNDSLIFYIEQNRLKDSALRTLSRTQAIKRYKEIPKVIWKYYTIENEGKIDELLFDTDYLMSELDSCQQTALYYFESNEGCKVESRAKTKIIRYQDSSIAFVTKQNQILANKVLAKDSELAKKSKKLKASKKENWGWRILGVAWLVSKLGI